MKTLKIKHILFLLLAGFAACNTADPLPPDPADEGELITTVKIVFTDSADAANTYTATFKDLDGPGGNAPVTDTIKLMAGKTYLANITLLDESKTPAEDITEEIEEEANDHMLFYTVSGVNVQVKYNDWDTNNPPMPLGLKTKWITTTAGTGTARVVLKHQAGTKNGTEAPGETDVEVNFPLIVQ